MAPRTKTLILRLGRLERARIEFAAHAAGLSLSEWARQHLLRASQRGEDFDVEHERIRAEESTLSAAMTPEDRLQLTFDLSDLFLEKTTWQPRRKRSSRA